MAPVSELVFQALAWGAVALVLLVFAYVLATVLNDARSLGPKGG